MAGSDTYLTREEVDVLLQVDASRNQESNKQQEAVPFDFRRPEKMSKEHEQSLRVVQGTFARNMAGNLSTFLRSIVRVELENLEETSYESFVAGVPTPSLMAVCSLPPLDGKVLFIIDPSLALVFIDRLMGGQGDEPSTVRELTEIEVMLISRVLDRILASLRDAWLNVVDVKPAIDQLEPSPHYVQLVPGTDTVIAFTFSVSMRASMGEVKFCVPFHMLKPLIPKLHEHLWFQDHDKPAGELMLVPEVRSHLLDTSIQMHVELGEADITVAELLDLQVGDCVVLNSLEGNELPVHVAGFTRLFGLLGVAGRSYAMHITRWEDELPATPDGNGGDKP